MGLAAISFMEGEQPDQVFSARFACPECGYSLDELEPRLFSFNNPAGACPSCDGLGVKQFFDESRIVQHPELTLGEGAIRGWDRRSVYYFHLLKSLAAHYNFDLDTPFDDLTADQQQVILHGSGEEDIDFSYVNDRGDVYRKRHRFEGIIPNFERRYKDTESQSVREELAKYLSTQACPGCRGTRLRREARNVFVQDESLPELVKLPVEKSLAYFQRLELPGRRGEIAAKILKEICDRLSFLVNVGLNYLTLDRSADTLSGGEAQRIRLASQIGAGLVGVMYILDEPSIGLHQRDNERLLNTLTRLRDLGNTVIVVEHDEDAIRMADYVIDIGPGAGVHGGDIVAQGTPAQVMDSAASLTGQYLSGVKSIAVPDTRTAFDKKKVLKLTGCKGNNLKKCNVGNSDRCDDLCYRGFRLRKSTLINSTLYPVTAHKLNKATTLSASASPYTRISGLSHLDKCIDIDQSPIGRTPRSNPATYTGIFTAIRELFAGTQEARSRGYKPGRFSFNVKGGRCEACQGDGVIKVEMHFLPDIYVPCDVCKGKRYNRETLEVQYKGKNIHEVLNMTVEDAWHFLIRFRRSSVNCNLNGCRAVIYPFGTKCDNVVWR